MKHYLRVESERLHIRPAFSIKMQEVPDLSDLGQTTTFDASGGQVGPETRCEIKIGGNSHKSGEVPETVAHEVFTAWRDNWPARSPGTRRTDHG